MIYNNRFMLRLLFSFGIDLHDSSGQYILDDKVDTSGKSAKSSFIKSVFSRCDI